MIVRLLRLAIVFRRLNTELMAEEMAGELITGPGVRNVGEFGLAEAIIPLELPLNRVDPSVRWMAELIRGEGKGGSGVTINQTIQPLLADPVAVAEQVANRTAKLVG